MTATVSASATHATHAMFQQSLAPMCIADRDLNIVAANVAFGRILGCTPSELLNRNILSLIVIEDRLRVSTGIEMVRGTRYLYEEIRARFERQDDRNEEIWLAWQANFDKDSQMLFATGRHIGPDDLRQVASGLAHDLNNELTGVVGSLELLRARLGTTENTSANQDMNRINACATRMAELVAELLYVAKGGKPVKRRLTLAKVLMGLQVYLHHRLGPSIALVLNPEVSLPPIMADPSQLRQAISNLVLNAAEAIGTNTGTITLSLRRLQITSTTVLHDVHGETIPDGDYATIVVHDTGPGMCEQTQTRLLEVGFSKKIGHHGLGMSIVAAVAEDHGAFVTLSSARGQGTTFQLLFPLSD